MTAAEKSPAKPSASFDKARKRGRPHAAKDNIPAVFYRHDPAYQKGDLNVSELARVCDLGRTTVYKYIGLLEA